MTQAVASPTVTPATMLMCIALSLEAVRPVPITLRYLKSGTSASGDGLSALAEPMQLCTQM